MDACIYSMYIPGLECTFTDNNEGVALVRMNSPETNITAIEMHRSNWYGHNQLVFGLHMKAETTDDEHTALFNMFNAPLQCVSGKTYDEFLPAKYFYTPVAENEYWGRLFAAQSREFTPFELRQTHLVSFVVQNVVTDDDVFEVIETMFGLIGIFRDADTKPARMC